MDNKQAQPILTLNILPHDFSTTILVETLDFAGQAFLGAEQSLECVAQ